MNTNPFAAVKMAAPSAVTRSVRPVAMTLACVMAAVAVALPDSPPLDGTFAGVTETVIVEAPQPRYVAPTLRDRIGRIWAPVYINEQGPFRLVLDTGANRSAVIGRVATSLGGILSGSGNAQLRGTTGSAIVPMIDVDRLQVGDLLIEATQLPILPDAFGGADGVLGYDGLRDKRIFIDFGNDLITIKRSQNERARPGYVTLPMRFLHDFIPMIDVYVGRTRVKAIIDTGAQRSIANGALFELLRRRGNAILPATVTGVTLDEMAGQALDIADIQMGGLSIPRLLVTFGDAYIFDYWKLGDVPAIMLGMDVLGTVDKLVIDYRRREVQLRLRKQD